VTRKGPAQHLSPGEVVARAYRAANRGRYAEANGYVARDVRQSLLRSRRLMVASRHKALASLAAVQDQQRRAQIPPAIGEHADIRGSALLLEVEHTRWDVTFRGRRTGDGPG
jgi:hypothetical protein